MTTQMIPHQQRLDELVNELIEDCMNPEALLGRNGLAKPLTRQLVECMLQTERADPLGYGKRDPAGRVNRSSRSAAG